MSEILPDLVLEKRFIDEDEGVTLLKGQTYLVKCGKVHLTGILCFAIHEDYSV